MITGPKLSPLLAQWQLAGLPSMFSESQIAAVHLSFSIVSAQQMIWALSSHLSWHLRHCAEVQNSLCIMFLPWEKGPGIILLTQHCQKSGISCIAQCREGQSICAQVWGCKPHCFCQYWIAGWPLMCVHRVATKFLPCSIGCNNSCHKQKGIEYTVHPDENLSNLFLANASASMIKWALQDSMVQMPAKSQWPQTCQSNHIPTH